VSIPKVGEFWGKRRNKKKIKEVKYLSNGWILLKTENAKSEEDFKVKVIFSLNPSHSMTPKHAHFLIDFYGKLCSDKEKAKKILQSIYKVWKGYNIENILNSLKDETKNLSGYPLEYILYALKWILEQEDINFKGRPGKKQKELDEILKKQGLEPIQTRKVSQLAIALFCDVANGTYPVEALIKANLDIRPNR